MSEQHRAEGRLVHKLHEGQDMLLSDVAFLKKEIKDRDERIKNVESSVKRDGVVTKWAGIIIAFGAFAYDFIAPLFQIRCEEGMHWWQGSMLCAGLFVMLYGWIKEQI